MRGKILPILSFLSLFGILFMLNYTSPVEAGVLGVLVFFTMIFILLFGVMVELIKIFQKILKDKNARHKKTDENKVYMYATVAAFGPIMLLMIQSFSSVNIFTVMLVAVFVFLGCFLIHKRA
ncbi:hypothetical protein IJ095_02505 [Candidatus Saccharibacteria bacterium]|nr:hypothetical protein [Candidatus Saccharibacteria bacterium]